MDAVTYPQADVISFLNSHFESLKINEKAAGKPEKEFMRAHRLLWSPAFVLMDHRGVTLRTAIGYRQPDELIADLSMALGKVALLHSKPVDAYDWFEHAYQTARGYDTAPESLYWQGIAKLRASRGDKDQLWAIWERLRQEFPGSRWSTSADCRDYPPRIREHVS